MQDKNKNPGKTVANATASDDGLEKPQEPAQEVNRSDKIAEPIKLDQKMVGSKRTSCYRPNNVASSGKRMKTESSIPLGVGVAKPDRCRGETEFDLWAKSVAKQLNDMMPSRALALQLKLQTILTEERMAHYENSQGIQSQTKQHSKIEECTCLPPNAASSPTSDHGSDASTIYDDK